MIEGGDTDCVICEENVVVMECNEEGAGVELKKYWCIFDGVTSATILFIGIPVFCASIKSENK